MCGTLITVCDRIYEFMDKRQAGKTERRRALREKLDAYKIKVGCKECGYKEHPGGLVFHHKDGSDKKFALSSLSKRALKIETIIEEIKKCDVLCSRCHSILHYEKRKNKLKTIAIDEEISKEKSKARVQRNKKRRKARIRRRRDFINSYKTEKGCAICGYNENKEELFFLEWPGPLRIKISYLIKKGVRWDEVIERVKRSEIFCKRHAYRNRRSYVIIDKNGEELTPDEARTYQRYIDRIKQTKVAKSVVAKILLSSCS